MNPTTDAISSYSHLAIPGVAQIVPGQGNLPKIHISTSQADADIYIHGAQVTSWCPKGAEEVIFLSEQSRWEDGKAIRGGIPVCFPWFRAKSDNASAPAHGLVRTKSWKLGSITKSGDTVVVALSTESDENTRKLWPYEFRLIHRITIGRELKLELITANTGKAAFHIEEALHTYYRVADVNEIRVAGLDGTNFLDHTDSNKEKVQHGDVILSKATDNAYLNTTADLDVLDPRLKRQIHIKKAGSNSTVVWNPWAAGAKALADMGDEEWQSMLCVEASNILSCAVPLAGGEEHTMAVTMDLIRK
jgi:glucose-6-phosphate 1-epimerase